MRDNSTARRYMLPPLIYFWCPHGHWWCDVNPRYIRATRGHDSDRERWCFDHEVERKEFTNAKISAKAIERGQKTSQEMSRLGLPKTKVCLNPDPTTHKVHAVLPAAKFYKRTYKSKLVTLDSRCKECRRSETKANREERKKDPKWCQKELDRGAKEREKKRKAREALKKEVITLPAGPLREWLKEHVSENGDYVLSNSEAARKILSNRGSDQSTVRVSTVEAIASLTGHPELVNALYPPASE